MAVQFLKLGIRALDVAGLFPSFIMAVKFLKLGIRALDVAGLFLEQQRQFHQNFNFAGKLINSNFAVYSAGE